MLYGATFVCLHLYVLSEEERPNNFPNGTGQVITKLSFSNS